MIIVARLIGFSLALTVIGGGVASAAAAEESGREVVAESVAAGSLVRSDLLDAQAILDDYPFPHAVDADKAAGVFVDVDHPLVFPWGGRVTARVSIATNASDGFFPAKSFDYVLFFNDPGLLDDDELRYQLGRELASIATATSGQGVYVYLHGSGEVRRVRTAAGAVAILDEAARQEWSGSRPDRVLEEMIVAGRDSLPGRELKFLWLLGRPLGNNIYRFENVKAVLAALWSETLEVSYCGYQGALEPGRVNELVRSFGGSSYYITEGGDLVDVLRRDFDYYANQALVDIEIALFKLGGNPSSVPLAVFRQGSMASNEHHTLLVDVQVPAIGAEEEAAHRIVYDEWGYPRIESAQGSPATRSTLVLPVPESIEDELPRDQPVLLVEYGYTLAGSGERVRGSQVVTISYSAHLEHCREATNHSVVKSSVIVDTYSLIGQIERMIRARQFDDAIARLHDQERAIHEVLSHEQDPLLLEDLELVATYKRRLLELKRDPDRASVILEELRRRAR